MFSVVDLEGFGFGMQITRINERNSMTKESS